MSLIIYVNKNNPNHTQALQSAINFFKKRCDQEGIFKELRKHEFYTKPSVARKQKSAEARKLQRKIDKIKERRFRDR